MNRGEQIALGELGPCRKELIIFNNHSIKRCVFNYYTPHFPFGGLVIRIILYYTVCRHLIIPHDHVLHIQVVSRYDSVRQHLHLPITSVTSVNTHLDHDPLVVFSHVTAARLISSASPPLPLKQPADCTETVNKWNSRHLRQAERVQVAEHIVLAVALCANRIYSKHQLTSGSSCGVFWGFFSCGWMRPLNPIMWSDEMYNSNARTGF